RPVACDLLGREIPDAAVWTELPMDSLGDERVAGRGFVGQLRGLEGDLVGPEAARDADLPRDLGAAFGACPGRAEDARGRLVRMLGGQDTREHVAAPAADLAAEAPLKTPDFGEALRLGFPSLDGDRHGVERHRSASPSRLRPLRVGPE